jgi:hypothetical protein
MFTCDLNNCTSARKLATNLSVVNDVSEDGHTRPQHVKVSCIYELL